MYILIEIHSNDSSMAVRLIDVFETVKPAMQAARARRNEHSRGLNKRESNFDYKHSDSNPRMAWTDVVYEDFTCNYTWVVLNEKNHGFMRRWFG